MIVLFLFIYLFIFYFFSFLLSDEALSTRLVN